MEWQNPKFQHKVIRMSKRDSVYVSKLKVVKNVEWASAVVIKFDIWNFLCYCCGETVTAIRQNYHPWTHKQTFVQIIQKIACWVFYYLFIFVTSLVFLQVRNKTLSVHSSNWHIQIHKGFISTRNIETFIGNYLVTSNLCMNKIFCCFA